MISLGIIGLGRWGPNILRNFLSMGEVCVQMVCDIDNNRLLQIQRRFPDIKTTTSLSEFLGNNTLDCIVISTPISSHFTLAKKSLESGCHVFIEKPLATSSHCLTVNVVWSMVRPDLVPTNNSASITGGTRKGLASNRVRWIVKVWFLRVASGQ